MQFFGELEFFLQQILHFVLLGLQFLRGGVYALLVVDFVLFVDLLGIELP